MKKILGWIIQNGILLTLCYLWLIKNMAWAGNIFSFLVWVVFALTIFASFLFFMVKVFSFQEPKFEKALIKRYPRWLDIGIDLIILIPLIIYGHFILATISL